MSTLARTTSSRDTGTSVLDDVLRDELAHLRDAGLLRSLRRFTSRQGASITREEGGRTVVDFSSNDYLGLASDPRLADAVRNAVSADATGAAAARLVSGNHSLHEELERAIASFKHSEAALLFSSGYMANVGVIPALAGREDIIYADALNHASLIDACRLSRAEVCVFPHSDMDALRTVLARDRGKYRRRMIVVDSVFSMDGDLAPLDTIAALAKEHGAWTYVDDAHGTGVLGATGRGAAEHWEVEGEIDVLMGTMGKALGVYGAFVCGSATLRDYLVNRARTFVFTTGTPALLAAAALEALRIAEAETWRRERLLSNTIVMHNGLRAIGFATGENPGHIVPIVLRDADLTVRVGRELLEKGFLVGAIRPPTVAPGGSRLRITISAAHDGSHIAQFLAALDDVVPRSLRTSG